ncbi:MAG: Adiponectin receptor protein 2, partial [Marteilia pararefringens]
MFELLSIENVYLWQNDNPYLLNRHRPVLNDFRLCFLSVFKLHTETFNIWTHLIGSLIMICLWIYFSIEIKNIDMADVAQMHLFFLFSTLCMGLSSLFHIVSCHSEPLKILYNKLDYVGILLMIAGSSIPVQHFMFYCRPGIRNCYLLINVVLCMVLIKFVMNPEFQDPKKLRKRGILFVSFGFFSILPLAHSSLLSYNQHVT